MTTFLLVASAVWPCCAWGQCLFRSLAFKPVRLQPDLEAFQEGAYKGAWGRGDLAFNFARQSRTGLHTGLRGAVPIRLSGVGAVQPIEEDTHTLVLHSFCCNMVPEARFPKTANPENAGLRFAGVWLASIPSHLLPVRRSWKVAPTSPATQRKVVRLGLFFW